MHSNNSYIADIIRSKVGAAELNAALAQAAENKNDLLLSLEEMGYNRLELFTCVAEHEAMRVVQLDETHPPSSAATFLSEETARRYQIVPLDDAVYATGAPLDLETIDTLRYLFPHPIELVATLPETIPNTLDRLYSTSAPAQEAAPTLLTAHAEILSTPSQSDEPIIKLVNLLIQEAFKQRASDIHLEPLASQFRVRYRIDGALRETDGPQKRLHPAVISRLKIMAGMRISEKRLPQDGRIEIEIEGRPLDLRVSSIPTNHGESIVMRILDKQTLALGLPSLGFDTTDQKNFERLIQYPDGVVLITGPTGSGKTTSLYACLNHLNQPDRKIITVEDPVEYQLAGINQVRARADIGLTFSTALRAMLRQAPNVIMIGEIRDRETAEIAINAALTGHFVLSTLHTNDAPSAITRLADIGIKPFLISSAVRGIVAQRLVRTICPHCKTAHQPSPADQLLVDVPFQTLWQGAGCSNCGNTGYLGRNGLFEIMNIDNELRQKIYTGSTSHTLRNAARKNGMRTLREDGFQKVSNGITTLNEVLRVTMKDDD